MMEHGVEECLHAFVSYKSSIKSSAYIIIALVVLTIINYLRELQPLYAHISTTQGMDMWW